MGMQSRTPLGLFFLPSREVNGPNKVALNLMSGLRKLGIPFSENELGDRNGCLQSWAPKAMDLPEDTLFGPNTSDVPSIPHVWARYKRFVANCKWTFDMYNQWSQAKGKMVGVWPVGIDTERFNDAGRSPTKDCLLYVKGVSERFSGDEERIQKALSKRRLSYSILRYGSYSERDLILATKTHSFCFLLTNTESQGIAYMEVLSSGLPCYVLKVNTVSPRTTKAYGLANIPASSTPYFSRECGISDDRNMSRFDEFLDRVSKFTPREYILRRHTLEDSARRYIQLVLDQDGSYQFDENEEQT